MNFADVSHLLDDAEWEVHPGPMAPYGNWPVDNREEFALVAAGRLPIVREACESGKYNAIVLLGGGEPGSFEAREIARPYGIPVTSCAWAQMHIATMLGNKFKWGTSFTGGAELFSSYGVENNVTFLPYKGGGPTKQAVLAGDADFTVSRPSTILSEIEAGTARPLLVGGEGLKKMFPDVPTHSGTRLRKHRCHAPDRIGTGRCS